MTGLFALLFAITVLQALVGAVEYGIQQKKFKQMGPAAQKIEEISQLREKIQERRNFLVKEIETSPPLGSVLRELSRLVPPSLVLKGIVYVRHPEPLMTLSGRVRAKPTPDLMLAEFLDKLNQSAFFENSTLESRSAVEGAQDASVQFTIRTRLVVMKEQA